MSAMKTKEFVIVAMIMTTTCGMRNVKAMIRCDLTART